MHTQPDRVKTQDRRGARVRIVSAPEFARRFVGREGVIDHEVIDAATGFHAVHVHVDGDDDPQPYGFFSSDIEFLHTAVVAAHGQCQECQAGSLDEDDFVNGPAMSDALKAELGIGRIPLFKIGERLLCASCRDNIGGWAGATTESIALVVNTADGDLVVAYAGKTISYEVENAGARIEDLLLDDAPKGFSIWEGTYRYDSDGDAKNVGKFRPLTPVEWRRLETTGVPWELAAANVPSRSET